MKKCSRCQKAHYCSPDCQRTHWKAHKAACGRVTAAQGDAELCEAAEAASDAADSRADGQ